MVSVGLHLSILAARTVSMQPRPGCRRTAPRAHLMLQHYALCQQPTQTWIDLENPTEEDILKLGDQYSIAQIYLQDVLQPEHLPKWEYSDEQGQYFVIGRYADPQAGRTADTIHSLTRKVAIFVREGRIITIHRGHIPFLEELREKSSDPDGKYRTPFHLLCKIFKELFRSYEQLVVDAGNELEFYEGKILQNKHLPYFLKGLFQIRRRSSVIRKVLLLSKTLLDALRTMDGDAPQVQDARDMYLRVETLSEDLYERSATLISMHLALSDQRANQVMKVLTIFSAFFLPNTFIAGIYGMNFDNMPELHTAYGYFAVLGGMLSISIAIWLWFRHKGWM